MCQASTLVDPELVGLNAATTPSVPSDTLLNTGLQFAYPFMVEEPTADSLDTDIQTKESHIPFGLLFKATLGGPASDGSTNGTEVKNICGGTHYTQTTSYDGKSYQDNLTD